MKLKAGALPYAIIITFIIVLLCTMYGMLTLANYNYYKSQINKSILDDNIESAFNLAKGKSELFPYNTKKKIDLFGDATDTASMEKKRWGLFDIILIKAYKGTQSKTKIALLGNLFDAKTEPALYVVDHNQSVFVGTEVSVKGKCCLPGGTLKSSGSISTNLPDDVSKSSTQNITYDENIFVNDYSQPSITDSSRNFDNIENKKINLTASFSAPTVILRSDNDLVLDQLSLDGNIVIFSKKKITIKNTCKLNNIIVQARWVKVEHDFAGSIQIIADDSVTIEKNTKLKYPSAIISKGKNRAFIDIQEDVSIAGGICLFNENKNTTNTGRIKVSKNCTITGIVYSYASVELNGKIKGSVYCDKLIREEKSMFYENELSNIQLSSNSMPINFASPIIFKKKPKTILQWLY